MQVTIEDRAWLAGLFDAEGCIKINKQDGKTKTWYKPYWTVTNGNENIIANTVRILDSESAAPKVQTNKQVYYVLEVGGKSKLPRVLDLILPWLAGKRNLADKTRIYCLNNDPNLAQIIRDKRFLLDKEPRLLEGSESISWLAGFMDGDGTMGVYKQRNRGGKFVYYANVGFVNNSDLNIARVKDVLNSNGIGYNEYTNTSNGRKAKVVQVTKNSERIKCLTALLPYLVGKRARAELVLRFLERNRKEDADPFYKQSRALNAPIGTPLTTREAPTLGEDIVD